MFPPIQPKLTIQSWSPWRKGWPRLIGSTCVTLYVLGLTFIFVALVLVNPLTTGITSYGTYTISGPMYQGNIFSGATKGDHIKTIQLYPGSDGAVQHKAWTCTKACYNTPGCHTFVIRGDECYLTSFNACQDPGKRYLLEWDGATTYELRPGNETELHQTCLAQCLEAKGCGECGRPLCNGSQCDDCPSTCWDITPSKSGYIVVFPTLGSVRKVKCDGQWQRWWRDGQSNLYTAMHGRLLKVRVVIYYEQGLKVQSDFASFKYKDGKIAVGKFIEGTAGNGWNAPFGMRAAITPPLSNCHKFFYTKGSCEANAVMSYKDQQAMNATKIQRGYSWNTGNTKVNGSIAAIELWIKPYNS